MPLDVKYVAPYEGWLNRETKEMFDILYKAHHIRSLLKEEWGDIYDVQSLITFCVIHVKGFFSVVPAYVWEMPQETVAWFEILNRLSATWGQPGMNKGSLRRVLQSPKTRKKVISNYIIPHTTHVSKNYTYTHEDTDQGRVMVFRCIGTKTVLRHVETHMTFLRVPSKNLNSLRLVKSFIDHIGVKNQVSIEGLKGFEKQASWRQDDFRVTSYDMNTGKWHQATCQFVGVLIDCKELVCKLFLDTKCEVIMNKFLQSPIDIGRKYLWT